MTVYEREIIRALNATVCDQIELVNEYLRRFTTSVEGDSLQTIVELLAGMNECAAYKHASKLGITAEDVKQVMQYRKLRGYRDEQLKRILDAVQECNEANIHVESPDVYLTRINNIKLK